MDLLQLSARVSPVPLSLRDSIKAWFTYSQAQAAESELYLFSRSGYFKGAELGNASAGDILADAFEAERKNVTSAKLSASHYATIGTEPAADGKVGYIRPIDIGSPKRGLLSRLFKGPSERHINTVEIGAPTRDRDGETNIVIVHGYGAGAAFFFRNMQTLASVPNSRVYAIDWLGMGRSSRPSFAKPKGKTVLERMQSTEEFFIDSLEKWRVKMNIDRMVLVGHSLGGYMSSVYALRYPERVSRLVLVSPAGFSDGSLNDMAQRFKDSKAADKGQKMPFLLTPRGQRIVSWAWNNVSPFAFVRSTAFFGPWMSSSYTRRRFGELEQNELRAIHAYCHGVFSDRSSSEKCLPYILKPGAYAHYPLASRIAPLKMPVSFLYGSHDWMDVQGGRNAVNTLREAGNNDAGVHVVDRAGHHFFRQWYASPNQLVRLRTKDGVLRIAVEPDDDAQVLIDKTGADASTLTLSTEPRVAGKPASELCGKTLRELGIGHGHLLYAEFAAREEAAPAAPAAPATPAEAVAPPQTSGQTPRRPWESVQEDAVDRYWATQDGRITRKRDAQFCRHGDKGMCDYCSPLEPYDQKYHTEHGIKHLSFHAYLRQRNTAQSGTYVPPLSEIDYKVRVPCPSGAHAPWPAGICTKCQPSAITLQRQPYRMTDHVEFAHPSIIEGLLDIWRKTNAQRFGFLIGHYEPYSDVPMGIKAVVEAIHEPPQQGDVDGLVLGIPWDDQERIQRLAESCGMQVLGMIYTDLEAADPTHTDTSRAGKVACKRHADSFFLSGAEAVFAAQLQQANRNPTKSSTTGFFNSRFVTCVLSGTPEGVIDVAAYQVSEQAMGMVEADMIEASVSPAVVRVKPSSESRFVPDVFYRYTNKYGLDVKESAKPTFPIEYLIVNVSHGFPNTPSPRFLSHSFNVENRPGLHDQELGTFLRGVNAAQSAQELIHLLSDWHLVAFLGTTGLLGEEDVQALARVATSHEESALNELVSRPAWQTISAIAATEGANDADAAAGATATGAAADTADDGAPAGTSDGISCPHCTFINASGSTDCDVCGLPL
ncbi:nuclear protein localization protein 4 [Malassezia cuniculi]|uniref:Nuclear protein localization protein 4 n=1 Tax=Malassezia cuniculi TaxID=948313 RepID=A0AAF0ETC0_9BASI|nr:nuclear protein localization protein 4 [Malassezia cuniculi]